MLLFLIIFETMNCILLVNEADDSQHKDKKGRISHHTIRIKPLLSAYIIMLIHR